LRSAAFAARIGTVPASPFDRDEFFRGLAASGARALLIGRQALVVLGLPVLTADYDFWLHRDDIAAFNAAAAPFDLVPTRSSAEALAAGRYVLENGERVDVLIARVVHTVDGVPVRFDDVWERRVTIEAAPGIPIVMPAIDDLIATKRFGGRPMDAEDFRLLQVLRAGRSP
jgi:hypothetical protein